MKRESDDGDLVSPEKPASPDWFGGLSALNVFRAIVCLQIVMMHIFPAELARWLGPSPRWAVIHLRFGFESFFVLAGYFLAHAFRVGDWSHLSVQAFVCRRLVRLAIPYWIAIVVGVTGFYVSSWLSGRAYEAGGLAGLWPLFLFVQDLIPPSSVPSATYWFMGPLIQFYLLWLLVFWVVRRFYLWQAVSDYHDRTLRVMKAIVVVGMFASLTCMTTEQRFRWKLTDNGVFLCLGCLTYWSSSVQGGRGWAAAGAAGLVVVGLYQGLSRPLAATVSVAIIPCLVRLPPLPASPVIRALNFIGSRSYSIYLTHTYVAYRVMNWRWGFTAHDSPAAALLALTMAMTASVLIGCGFYALVEGPTAQLARGISFRGRQPLAPPA